MMCTMVMTIHLDLSYSDTQQLRVVIYSLLSIQHRLERHFYEGFFELKLPYVINSYLTHLKRQKKKNKQKKKNTWPSDTNGNLK